MFDFKIMYAKEDFFLDARFIEHRDVDRKVV